MTELAPVVLFVYNRPWHTRQMLESLQRNELASESELFIYSDASKNSKANAAVQEVRDYIYSVSGFKKITIIERKYNRGLADSIIDGVTSIVNKYGRVIVLEDDLVTSPFFLKFMNDALSFYENEKRVWHISGWSYPIEIEELTDVFLWRVMNCWGWATWSDRWCHYEKNVDETLALFDDEMIRQFDLDNSGIFWNQILANKKGCLNTWAIFWYASIFLKKGFCLNPSVSFVQNRGHDGSGVHCGVISDEVRNLNMKGSCEFPLAVNESILIREKIEQYYKTRKNTFAARLYNMYLRIKRKVVG